MSYHWSEQYLGVPWKSGAQGPDAFDCWSFFRHVQRRQYGRDLPIIDVDANNLGAVQAAFRHHPERQRWVLTETPSDGDCVLFFKAGEADHVGVWLEIDRGRMLHSIPKSGVVLTNMVAARRLGWNPIQFYTFRP